MNRLGVFLVVAVPILLMMVLTPPPAVAAPGGPVAGEMPPTPAGKMPPTPPGVQAEVILDADGFAEVVDITERITPYLYVDEQGLVQLAEVTADELGVTEEFLANFREAMGYSNQLIQRGEIRVAPDLTVAVTDRFAPLEPRPGPGLARSAAGLDGAVDALPGGENPDWGAWNYGSGAMFYNSYSDWIYYRYRYYGLCTTMAAYLRLPWMSQHLIYFYGYNVYYLNLYCYNPYGTYFFIPFAYCQSPLGWKPAYFWVQIYGPYGWYWGWQGFWVRY